MEMPRVSPYRNSDGETEHPYAWMSCYVDRDGNRYGVVRRYKSLQDEINHRRSRALHMLNTKRVIAEERINDLVPLFRRLRNLAVNQPGYISGETLKCIDNPGQYLVISTWQSLDDWREWVVSRERIEVQNEIDARLDEETVYEIYQYG